MLIPAAAFLVGVAFRWPATLWFRDEVGYVGQARLLLSGRLHPDATSVLHAWITPGGPIAEYPFAFPALLALPFAMTPRAVFVIAIAAAIVLGCAAARQLTAWGHSPSWGFTVLLFPTALLFSRTVMADVPLAAAGVLAWTLLRNRRIWPTAATFSALVLLKPTGLIVAGGLVVGEFLRRSIGPDAKFRGTVIRELAPAALGAAVGLVAALVINRAATGSFQFAYARSQMGFAWIHLGTTGIAHLKTLVLVPPGLVLGAIPLWRRREYGAIVASTLLIAVMCCFSFVDSGRNALESLVVAPRLILPAVVFLLVGWIDAVASRVEAVVPRRVIPWSIAACLLVATVATGVALAPLERTRREALSVAENALRARGGSLLGLGDGAFEAGLLTTSAVVWAAPGARDADVVLCATEIESLRTSLRSNSCTLDGYEELSAIGPYRVLGRVAAPRR